ncbi:MAG: hypothetical protein DID89_2727548023 [Candidatus Nitrotoga sp. CP45]|nr:MAG: hypothetical protein DID89_2727548023 [Candidatus Nitrotoga sp. CP45]
MIVLIIHQNGILAFKREVSRQLPFTQTDQWPDKSPLNGCHYQPGMFMSDAAGGTYIATVNLTKQRSDELVWQLDDLRLECDHGNDERRAFVYYSGDGGVTRTPARDMALAAG